MKLKDKVAVITGGGSGIGRAIALGFAKEGAVVVVCGRRVEKLKETTKEIDKLGWKSLALKMDLTKTDEVKSGVKEISKKFGKIDILVNNAAFIVACPNTVRHDDCF